MICMTLVDSATIPIDDLRGIQLWHDFEYCHWLQKFLALKSGAYHRMILLTSSKYRCTW